MPSPSTSPSSQRSSLRRTSSLRTRVAWGVALPVFLALLSISWLHYKRETALLDSQLRLMATRLAESLRNSIIHTLPINDEDHMLSILHDVSALPDVERIMLVGISGRVIDTNQPAAANIELDFSSPECQGCHQYPEADRPATLNLPAASNVLRVAAPVYNQKACTTCHREPNTHLGVLLVDVSLTDIQSHVLEDLRQDIGLTILLTTLVAVGGFFLMHQVVVRRIEALRRPILAYTEGDHNMRIKLSGHTQDELFELAEAFNNMADEITRRSEEAESIRQVRMRAVLEERERIARELHDNVAQVLGFVATKSQAVRKLMTKGRLPQAETQLLQLEEAAHDVFVDLREAILGLKSGSTLSTDLIEVLGEYLTQFSRLHSVQIDFSPPANPIPDLPATVVFEMLRILQEALTNARKHAQATHLSVNLDQNAGVIRLEIWDDGRGFAVAEAKSAGYGLELMRQRAESIQAQLHIRSAAGRGTRVLVELDTYKFKA